MEKVIYMVFEDGNPVYYSDDKEDCEGYKSDRFVDERDSYAREQMGRDVEDMTVEELAEAGMGVTIEFEIVRIDLSDESVLLPGEDDPTDMSEVRSIIERLDNEENDDDEYYDNNYYGSSDYGEDEDYEYDEDDEDDDEDDGIDD